MVHFVFVHRDSTFCEFLVHNVHGLLTDGHDLLQCVILLAHFRCSRSGSGMGCHRCFCTRDYQVTIRGRRHQDDCVRVRVHRCTNVGSYSSNSFSCTVTSLTVSHIYRLGRTPSLPRTLWPNGSSVWDWTASTWTMRTLMPSTVLAAVRSPG